jgi:hypothetical protein
VWIRIASTRGGGERRLAEAQQILGKCVYEGEEHQERREALDAAFCHYLSIKIIVLQLSVHLRAMRPRRRLRLQLAGRLVGRLTL